MATVKELIEYYLYCSNTWEKEETISGLYLIPEYLSCVGVQELMKVEEACGEIDNNYQMLIVVTVWISIQLKGLTIAMPMIKTPMSIWLPILVKDASSVHSVVKILARTVIRKTPYKCAQCGKGLGRTVI